MENSLCKKGHLLSGTNLLNKQCKKCWLAWHNEYRKSKRQQRGLRSHGLRTHCPQGHPYDATNTSVKPNGHRNCKACRREGMIRLARAKGIKPAVRLTGEQKLANRRKWQAERNAKLHYAYVERVEPLRVFKRDKGICQICSVVVGSAWELDHIIPLSRGGEHSYKNIQLAHPRCNRVKWAHLPI